MPITSAEPAASRASACRSSPSFSTTGSIPRRLASSTRSNFSTLPPPDLGFISSTAFPGSLTETVLTAGASTPDDSARIALRAAKPNTAPATRNATSSSTAPSAISAVAPPTSAATATISASTRSHPWRVSAIQPAAAAITRARREASNAPKSRNTSTTSVTITAAPAIRAIQAASRPERDTCLVEAPSLIGSGPYRGGWWAWMVSRSSSGRPPRCRGTLRAPRRAACGLTPRRSSTARRGSVRGSARRSAGSPRRAGRTRAGSAS